MGRSSALIVSAILMMPTFVATPGPVKYDTEWLITYPISTSTIIPSPCLTYIRAIQRTVTQYTTVNECNNRPSTQYYYTTDAEIATITQSTESGGVARKSNTKRANIAAGVVGGFIGFIFGIVLTVLVIAVAAILITKRHKNRYV